MDPARPPPSASSPSFPSPPAHLKVAGGAGGAPPAPPPPRSHPPMGGIQRDMSDMRIGGGNATTAFSTLARAAPPPPPSAMPTPSRPGGRVAATNGGIAPAPAPRDRRVVRPPNNPLPGRVADQQPRWEHSQSPAPPTAAPGPPYSHRRPPPPSPVVPVGAGIGAPLPVCDPPVSTPVMHRRPQAPQPPPPPPHQPHPPLSTPTMPCSPSSSVTAPTPPPSHPCQPTQHPQQQHSYSHTQQQQHQHGQSMSTIIPHPPGSGRGAHRPPMPQGAGQWGKPRGAGAQPQNQIPPPQQQQHLQRAIVGVSGGVQIQAQPSPYGPVQPLMPPAPPPPPQHHRQQHSNHQPPHPQERQYPHPPPQQQHYLQSHQEQQQTFPFSHQHPPPPSPQPPPPQPHRETPRQQHLPPSPQTQHALPHLPPSEKLPRQAQPRMPPRPSYPQGPPPPVLPSSRSQQLEQQRHYQEKQRRGKEEEEQRQRKKQQQQPPPPQKEKIDPNQIPRVPLFTRPHHAPSTVYVSSSYKIALLSSARNKSTAEGTAVVTNAPPPPPDSRYLSIDGGNAAPRAMRCTTHVFPTNGGTARKVGVELGLVVCPLGAGLTTRCGNFAMVRGGHDEDGGDGDSGKEEEDIDVYGDDLEDDDEEYDYVPPLQEFRGDDDGKRSGGTIPDPERVPVIRGPPSPRSTGGRVGIFGGGGAHHVPQPQEQYPQHQTQYHSQHQPPLTTNGGYGGTAPPAAQPTGGRTRSPPSSSSRAVTPPRCDRCQAYLNPFCPPSSSSRGFSSAFSSSETVHYDCNMCGARSSISIDESVHRDAAARGTFDAALRKGTVEYEVAGPYLVRKGGPVRPVHIYAVDANLNDGGGDGGERKWLEALEAVRAVGEGLACRSRRSSVARCRRRRRSHDGGDPILGMEVGDGPRVGLFAFREGALVFPYFKKKMGGGEELAAAIVSDVHDDPFCPLPLDVWTFDVCAYPLEGEGNKELERFYATIDAFPRLMHQIFGSGPPPKMSSPNCGGAALVVLVDALKESGGRAALITSRRPNFGVGALRDREGAKHSNYLRSENERRLFSALQKLKSDGDGGDADEKAGDFYRKLGEVCAKNCVCLDIIVNSSASLRSSSGTKEFFDVATLAELCRASGGKFKWLRVDDEYGVALEGDNGATFHGEQLRDELKRSALAYMGNDVVFKLRCSNGVQVKSYCPEVPTGTLVGDGIVNSAELELPSVDASTTIAVLLEHKVGGVVDTLAGSGKGKVAPMVFFQSAVLYTTLTGRRRVRVSTLGLNTSTTPSDIFRSTDLGTVAAILTRRAVSNLDRPDDEDGTLNFSRDSIVSQCVDILANYRMYTSARSSPSGQLVLPETLQLLPLFCLSLRKSRMFRYSLPKGAPSSRPFPTADERAYHLFYGARMSPSLSLQCVHSNMFKLREMRTRDGEWIAPTRLEKNLPGNDPAAESASMHPVCQLPRSLNPSITCLEDDGIYLLDDRFAFYLYVGKGVQEHVWRDLVTASSTGASSLSLASTPAGEKLHRILEQLQLLNAPNQTIAMSGRPTSAPLILVLAGQGGMFEEEMGSLLVDDPDSHEKSYVDFLCSIHRQVRDEVSFQT